MPAAMSIWERTQPPKMWPLALMSPGRGTTRRIGSALVPLVVISLSAAPASSSWPERLLRKTRPISPVPTSTVSPTPAMVAITMWTGTGSPKLFR